MNVKQLICPVSTEKVNENIVRTTAFFVILLVVAGMVLPLPALLVLVAGDFFIRAFTRSKLSPISFVSKQIVSLIKLKAKPIDKAPKIFAARMGFLMSAAVVLLYFAQLPTASLVVAAILTFFAALELVAGFCMGCLIYTFVVRAFDK